MAEVKLELPKLSTKPKDFLKLLSGKDHRAVEATVQPYIEYENALRRVFAQQRDHPAVKDNGMVNCVPLFDGSESELTIRARSLASESVEQQSKYIMPLNKDTRKPDGTLATAASLEEFRYNFSLFSENCLAGLDWSNIVAAGSSVLTPLLAVPDKYKGSKRGVRQYYHQVFAPASDIDLFIYGLTEEEALRKMNVVEQTIRDNILLDTVTIRTRHAVTIVSKHPNRHVQVVLRLYDSISELITGFDVDASAVVYDGHQVWASPRAVAAIVTQVNTLDLERRSPSYENRLAKYAQRGFEVYWPQLERSRIDPTIFERHFPRTNGLARLLVLEKLPKGEARDNYRKQRRTEQGRPERHEPHAAGRRGKLRGNIKDDQPEDIADWTFEDDYSSYHSFTIPYGPKFDAKRIEKQMYTRDLLLNAEWNKPKDRQVDLHRHPCFIGTMDEVQEDCCGFCPEPVNDEDKEIEKEEHKNFVFGKVTFLKDNPGRQEIGSFNPITDDDFTLMAYIGNTAELCAAISSADLEKVKEWCSRPGADVNVRDHTGRTPLHLATLTSSPEIVQYLIDQGARIVARLVDGMTALHIAAARGNAEMVSSLLRKSEENEEIEADKESRRKKSKEMLSKLEEPKPAEPESKDSDDESSSDVTEESEDYEESDVADDETQGSFVKVKKEEEATDPLDGNEDDPDVYDVNVLAWDIKMSPLQLAIICGHTHIVELLVKEFGADPLLPFVAEDAYGDTSNAKVIMSLSLATTLPLPQAKEMILTLLKNGCTSAQADPKRMSAFHYVVKDGNLELVKLLCEQDAPHPASVMNNLARIESWQYSNNAPDTPLITAIKAHDVPTALFLSDRADNTIKYDNFIQWLKIQSQNYYQFRFKTAEQNKLTWEYRLEQPIEIALGLEELDIVRYLIPKVDLNKAVANTSLSSWSDIVEDELKRRTILDEVDTQLEKLRGYKKPEKVEGDVLDNTVLEEADYLAGIKPGSYAERYTRRAVARENAQRETRRNKEEEEKRIEKPKVSDGEQEKYDAIQAIIAEYESLRELLVSNGAKTAKELGWKTGEKADNGYGYNRRQLFGPNFGSTIDKYKRFDPNLKFDIGDITETSKTGYIQLFEAAWEGNFEKVNEFTTGFWGDNNPPLEIAVKDSFGWSPFFIACARGHLRLAQHIVEIARIQYRPEEEKARYEIGNDYEYDDYYSHYDSESEDENELSIRKRVIENVEMIENVATIHNSVSSKIKPLDMVNWATARLDTALEGPVDTEWPPFTCSAMDYAALYNEQKLFKFLLQLLKSVAAKTSTSAMAPGQLPKYAFVKQAFAAASKYDRVDMLKEVIKTYGYGVEVEDNQEGSPTERSKYYKGLTIGGKKRADWVKNGRGRRSRYDQATGNNSLALKAIRDGAYNAAAFLFGDGPRACFDQFRTANPEDAKSLAAERPETFKTFWGTNEHLTLHAFALGAKCGPKSIQYAKRVIADRPELLETQNMLGFTPLYVAMCRSPLPIAELFLSLGANPKTRDNEGRTLAHAILVDPNGDGRNIRDPLKTKDSDAFELFDPETVKELLLSRSSGERCSRGSRTPLDEYMSVNTGNFLVGDFLSTLKRVLHLSKGEDLRIPNDHGDYPLHTAVKSGWVRVTQLFIETCPEILHRENANGQTPLDLVNNKKIVGTAQELGNDNRARRGYRSNQNSNDSKAPILLRQPIEFVEKPEPEKNSEYEEVDHDKVYEIIHAAVKQRPGPRKLVSLFEANALAERLANQHFIDGQSRTLSRRSPRLSNFLYSGWNNISFDETDEVFRWWS